MKKIYLSLLLICSIIQLKAQGFELSIQANTGMSHYGGKGAVSTTFLNAGDPTNHSGYPNGDGKKYVPDYGVDLQLQYTCKSNFLFGVQAGYEGIGSKVSINGVYDGTGSETPATGSTKEYLNYFNINPYIGFRFKLSKVKLDVMPGLDFGLGLSTHETVNVKASDGTFYNKHTDNYYKPGDDTRLRLGLAAGYGRYAVTASYSRAFNAGTRYADSYVPPEHLEIFRLGVSYRIW